MSEYVKDEINFYKFLYAMRQLHEVTLEQACEGLCSISMMQRIENGERLPEKQMRDRILARMGVALEGYEDHLSIDEYEQWILRQKLLKSIENQDVVKAEQYLDEYRIYENQNSVEQQYCVTMEFMILQMKNESLEKRRAVIERAVGLTMPKIENGLSKITLLSEQELNLLTEYVWLREYTGEAKGEFEWRCNQYKEILEYIEHSHLDEFCRAKIYPKVAYYLSEIILHSTSGKDELEIGIKACNEAIELLRDSNKLYYFIELVDALEKLIQEYRVYADKENGQVNLEILQASLQEKRVWREVLIELYNKHGISPYMKNFCHLYWEMESYCIGDVIRMRREMLDMTKEQLCEGICSVKTLTRIEQKKVKTQMAIVRALYERIGLCAEYIRARVITNHYYVMKLAEELVWYENNCKIEEWEQCLEKLKKKLCVDIPQNKQFIMSSYYSLCLQKKLISNKQYINKMIEIVEYTLPWRCAIKKGEKFLSQEEYTYIRNIGMCKDEEIASSCMTIIRELSETETGAHIRKNEFLMESIISYLGNIGEYEQSDKLSIRMAEESLASRRAYILADSLYNNLWNYQQRISRQDVLSDRYMTEMELKRCILLSQYNKKENLVDFFQKMLEELK